MDNVPSQFKPSDLANRPPLQPIHPIDFPILYSNILDRNEEVLSYSLEYALRDYHICDYYLMFQIEYEGFLETHLVTVRIETLDPTLSEYRIKYYYDAPLGV